MPLPGCRRAERERYEHREYDDCAQDNAPAERRLQLLEHVVELRAHVEVRIIRGRREPASECNVREEEQYEYGGRYEEQPHTGDDAYCVGRTKPDRIEPEELGVDVLTDIEDDVERDQDCGDSCYAPPAAESGRADTAAQHAKRSRRGTEAPRLVTEVTQRR